MSRRTLYDADDGAAIETAARQSLTTYVRNTILRPLGFTHTDFTPPAPARRRHLLREGAASSHARAGAPNTALFGTTPGERSVETLSEMAP